MIPKHIIVTNDTRPDAYIENLSIWNPDFKIIFFSDEQCETFIQKNFSQRILQAYQDIKPGAYKADIFRYCALYILGGVYTDIHIPYQRSFSTFWDLSQDFLYLVQDAGQGHSIQISTMATPPKSKFFLLCIEKAVNNIERRIFTSSPYSVTGPELAGQCLKTYIGLDSFELGQIYHSIYDNEFSVSLNYRLVWLTDDARKKIARSAFVDTEHRFLFPYKLNQHRTNWQKKTHYYKAWHLKDIYVENS